jgi:hypothetical protein
MQMAMVVTPQKPTQRDRFGEIPEDLSGSTKSVVCVERSVRNLGGPTGSYCERETRGKAAQGLRIMSHGRGNPDTEVGRSLNEAEDESDRAQQVGCPKRNEGKPTAARESDQPIVLGGRASRLRGEGADRYTQPAQDTWTGHEGSEKPCKPPCRV